MNKIELIKEEKKIDWINKMEIYLDGYITYSNGRNGIELDFSENSIHEIDRFCKGIHSCHIDEYGYFRKEKIGCFDFMAVFITRIFEANYEVGNWEFQFELKKDGDCFIKKIEYVSENFRFNPVNWIKENIEFGNKKKVSARFFQMIEDGKLS